MAVIERNQNISFISSVAQLSSLLKKIKDLTTINPRIIMRIEQSNILLFSFVGDSFKNIHAFKNYVFPIEEIMTIKKGEIDEPLFFIARDGKKFYKILENLLDYKDDIKCKISINEENYVNYISFDNTNKDHIGLDIKIIGSDPVAIGSQISIDDINYLMDTEKSLFNFRINNMDFYKIKKMGTIDNEAKSVLYINITDKILSVGEMDRVKWKLNITPVESEDMIISFPKAYFNTINPSDFIDVYVFEEFILCKYDDFNLMILLETTI
jgi:hypothetical protein